MARRSSPQRGSILPSGRGISRTIDDINAYIIKVLTEGLSKIAEDAKANASWSSDIPGAIRVGEVKISGQNISGRIEISLKEAPQAAAFEYGSGIHRTKGTPDTYEIHPKEKQVLAFHWEGHTADYPTGRKYVGQAPDGRLMFMYVDHPGVAPKPFLKPAIEKNRKEIIQSLAQAVKRGYKLSQIRREVIEVTI